MTLMNSEPISATLRVTQLLESLQVPYVIGGSMASTTYGRIRTTMDVDIVADMKLVHVTPFVKSLQDEFYVDEQAVEKAIQSRRSFNLIHLETMFKVDIFVVKERPFDQQQLSRRQLQMIGTNETDTAYVTSPEDTILAKLDWYRLGGEVSERQWRDIQGILEVSGSQLDETYLREWARNLGVDDLLRRLLT